MLSERPIFIRGLSRSGGTLLVTILDAHPDVAMSYELYPDLLNSLSGNEDNKKYFLDLLSSENGLKKTVSGDKSRIRAFVARCYRSGLERVELKNIYDTLKNSYSNLFDEPEHAMLFLESCAKRKMEKEGKSRWGMKCSNDFNRYLSVWPNAQFLNVVRDGRDILASQLVTGSFNKTARDVARGYANVHKKFKAIIEDENVSAKNVFYEKLVTDAESSVSRVCDFLNIPYNVQMLNYYKQDLTIYNNSMGHLSFDRISKPLDASKIGRWKSELSSEQVTDFYEVAKGTLEEFGYL